MNRFEGHDLIGKPAWDKLVAHAGGCEFPVPTRIDSGSGEKLVALMGLDAAARLIAYAAGDSLYIAAGWDAVLRTRYAEIIAWHEQGMSPAQISLQYTYVGRYTERNIRMILSGRFEGLEQVGCGEQLGIPGI